MSARLTINFFTPLPPQQTSIADHSARLLPALCAIADVTVWTYQELWDPLPIPGLQVHRFDPTTPPQKFHDATVNFYNLGNNNQFHEPIFKVSRKVPGVVILHDPNMGYFFGHLARSDEGRRFFLDFVTRQYGREGLDAAVALFSGKLRIEDFMMRYPMTEAALTGALAVVVHNRPLQAQLERDLPMPSYCVPLSHLIRQPERTRRTSAPPYRLVTFGYLGANRRLENIADALATFPQRDLFRWDIYGTMQVRRWPVFLKTLRLRHMIATHDFVDEHVLDDALAKADLAINLRNPTMGEASSSQLRIWEHGLASLASRVGWYADQPPDTLFFVEPEHEVESIQQYLTDFLYDREPFLVAGERGRKHCVDVHNTEQYARAIVGIAEAAPLLHRRKGAAEYASAAARAAHTLWDPRTREWTESVSASIEMLV